MPAMNVPSGSKSARRRCAQVEFRMGVLRLLTWAAEWELWLRGESEPEAGGEAAVVVA